MKANSQLAIRISEILAEHFKGEKSKQNFLSIKSQSTPKTGSSRGEGPQTIRS